MAYEKHTWQSNELVTAEKLNHIEQGIAGVITAPLVVNIPTGQWSGSGSDYYISVTASNVTADSILVPTCDRASEELLKGSVWCVPAAGSFTIHTNAIPAGTITIMVQFVGTLGEAQYQVLADVYSKSQVDTLTAFVPSTGNAGFHNSIYRGKNLGTSVTAAQWTAISAGTFDDLFIGDYWVINSIPWRIAAFDYWWNYGYPECYTHHIVIVPEYGIGSCRMNKTNITTGAYVGSDYYTGANDNTDKATAQDVINGAFGSEHILTHGEYLKNTTKDGYESNSGWYDSTFELMTEQMVYGCKVFGNVKCGTNAPASYAIDTSQLPLFRHNHAHICTGQDWWLRDVASERGFAKVERYGVATFSDASNRYFLRPAFGIRA